MIERGWFDAPSSATGRTARCSSARTRGRLLTERDLSTGGQRGDATWPGTRLPGVPLVYDPARGRYEVDGADLALFGEHAICTRRGRRGAAGRAFELCAELLPPLYARAVESISGVDRGRRSSAPPGSCGRRGRSPTTRGAASRCRATPPRSPRDRAALRADRQLRRPGGNVLFPAVPTAGVVGDELPPAERRAVALGSRGAPAGPGAVGVRRRPTSCTAPSLERRALRRARPGRLRRQPAAVARRRPARARGAGRARLLRPRRPVHEPHGRAGRRRPAGRERRSSARRSRSASR